MATNWILPRLTFPELQQRARDAARTALRSEIWSPDDRADCAADIVGNLLAACAKDEHRDAADWRAGKRGKAADVLAFLKYWEDRPLTLERACNGHTGQAAMPARNDFRASFPALRNDAADWRKSREHRRELEAMLCGAADATGETFTAPEAVSEADHAHRLAAQSAGHARKVAERLATDLGDMALFPALYVWARDADAAEVAAELGMTPESLRQATSRATRNLRKRSSAADVLATAERIMGTEYIAWADRDYFTTAEGRKNAAERIISAGSIMFSTGDESRAALARAGHQSAATLAPADRIYAEGRPERPLTRQQANDLCIVRRIKAAPVSSAQRRDAAHAADGYTAEQREARARARLSAAQRAGRPDKQDVGHTAGTARNVELDMARYGVA